MQVVTSPRPVVWHRNVQVWFTGRQDATIYLGHEQIGQRLAVGMAGAGLVV